jgi:hypothetical protein
VGAQQQEPPATPKAKKVTSVVRPSQTEPSEETTCSGLQEMREEDAQTQEPPQEQHQQQDPQLERERERKRGTLHGRRQRRKRKKASDTGETAVPI